jgi:cytochrome c
MKTLWIAAFAGAMLAAPAFAQEGDAAAGEAAFNQCATCHHIEDASGTTLAGRANVKTGPNLWHVIGRTAGTVEGFRYRPDIVAAGEAGLVWDQEKITAYIQDPGAYLTEVLGKNARSGMAYKVRDPAEAANIAAYLATFGTFGG